MANIQVKNIPDALHKRLKQQAKKQNCTMSKIALKAIERQLERDEWFRRAQNKSKHDLNNL